MDNLPNGYLPSGEKLKEIEFPRLYTKIVYLADSQISWDTSKNIVFRLFSDKNFSNSITYRLNYWMELTQEKYQYLFYQCDKIVVPNKEFKKLFPNDLQNIISSYNDEVLLPIKTKQYFISEKIKHIEEQFKSYLKINDNDYKYLKNEHCYFFGLYNETDFNRL